MTKGFANVYNRNCVIAIVGSRATGTSLERGFYYTSNRIFHEFISKITGDQKFLELYETLLIKKRTCCAWGESERDNVFADFSKAYLDSKIALIDMLSAFEATSSSDKDTNVGILNEEIMKIFENKNLFFFINGTSKTKNSPLDLFNKFIKKHNIHVDEKKIRILPSLSGANTTMSAEDKRKKWEKEFKSVKK